MRIDFTKFTDHELSKILLAAAAELESRLNQDPGVKRVPAPERRVVLQEPPPQQKDFCLYIKRKLQSGEYIKSDERQTVADIAEQYPDWVRRQQLPTEKGTGAWRRAADYFSRGVARER